RGRGGDLNPALWHAAHLAPGNYTEPTNRIRQSTIPTCRAGITSPVYPPDDALICDGTSSNPGTLLTSANIQYYGSTDYMIRQPFDFAGRTGKIAFDVDAVAGGRSRTWVNL